MPNTDAHHRQSKRLAFDDLPVSPTPFHYYSLLTMRERRFVDSFVATLDLAKASRDAGIDSVENANRMLSDKRVRCALRERQDAVSELAGVTAADLRRELKLIHDADPTELSGVHKVPCRHCWGMDHQFQYTDAELYYVEQAHSYGEEGWPFSCVTNEFGHELHRHAQAAWLAGKNRRALFLKGGGGYSRLKEINRDCPQCGGDGTPVAWICDTRTLSENGRKILKGIRLGDNRLEVLTIDRSHVREMLARDLRVGVERKELVVTMPRTPDELRRALESMPVRELEEFVHNVLTLGEGEYEVAEQVTLPRPEPEQRVLRRGN